MKKIMNKVTLLIVAAVSFSYAAQAQAYLQDPKYGNTPEERQQNVLRINYFNDAYKNKQYDQAIQYMNEVIASAPRASQNIYINGINIFRSKVAEAKTPEARQAALDSLMMLYDLRIENFGDHPTRGRVYLLALKTRDYLSLNPTNKEEVKRLFNEAMDAASENADPDLINIYFNALVEDYKNDALSTDELLSEYDRLSTIYDKCTAEDKDEQKKVFDNLFVSSGAASCENLEKVFRPTIEANPSVDELKKVFRLLAGNNCLNDFQILVSEKLYAVEPSTDVAMLLASAYENKKDFANSRKYLNEAIADETDPAAKANLAIRIAGGELQQGNSREAADFARQALEIDPENGYAYLLLANAYAAGANACSGFDRQTVFWLVVDTLTKAKELLANDAAQVSSIDQQLASYRAAFPSNEEAFFRGLENGQGYTVNCGWVSGRTVGRLNR